MTDELYKWVMEDLPMEGEWDGLIHGAIGVLRDDGDKAECHACGGYYKNLAIHAIRTHGLTAREYRLIFGIASGTGLAGPTLKALVSARMTTGDLSRNPAIQLAQHSVGRAWPTPEQRAQSRRALSAESRRSDVRQQGLIKQAASSSKGQRERPRSRAGASKPGYYSAFMEKICVVCGVPYTGRLRTTCSPVCRDVLRSRNLPRLRAKLARHDHEFEDVDTTDPQDAA